MKWVTRERIHIDRAACAWLIRRHIDQDAEFLFVADPADIPGDAIGFDIPGAELSHHAGDCSFRDYPASLRPRRSGVVADRRDRARS